MSPGQKFVAVAGFPQGLGGHSPHLAVLGFVKASQPLGKAGQAVPAALHGFRGKVAVGIQPAALANRFFEVLRAEYAAVVQLSDFKAKTVGPQVQRSQ